MEEADCLSQRIAIIASGKLKAVASPSTLKREFGVGYRVKCKCTQTKLEKLCLGVNIENDVIVREIGPRGFSCEATLIENTISDSGKSVLAEFFKMVEKVGIPYSLVSSSLEDVFLRLTTGSAILPKQDEISQAESTKQDYQTTDFADNPKGTEVEKAQPETTNSAHDISVTSKTCKNQSKCMRTDRSWTSRQISNFLSSLYIDGFLLYRNHWLFFALYALAFLVVPMAFMLLCNLSSVPSDLNEENTTVVLHLNTVFDHPIRVKLFDVSEEDLQLFEKALPGVALESNEIEEDLFNMYYSYPYAVYSRYPFFIRKNSRRTDEFSCILNMNFAPRLH